VFFGQVGYHYSPSGKPYPDNWIINDIIYETEGGLLQSRLVVLYSFRLFIIRSVICYLLNLPLFYVIDQLWIICRSILLKRPLYENKF